MILKTVDHLDLGFIFWDFNYWYFNQTIILCFQWFLTKLVWNIFSKCDIHFPLKNKILNFQCEKKFGNRRNLLSHMRRHTGDFKLFCPDCGKGFFTQSKLESHKRKHTGLLHHLNDLLGPVHACEQFFHKEIFPFVDVFKAFWNACKKIVHKCCILFGLSNIFLC